MIKYLFVACAKHVLKDRYMLNYETINHTNRLYYSSIEVLIDLINSVVATHVFYKQLYFLIPSSYLWLREFSVWLLSSSYFTQSFLSLWLLNNFCDADISMFLPTVRLIFKWFFFSTWAWVLSICLVFLNKESCLQRYQFLGSVA